MSKAFFNQCHGDAESSLAQRVFEPINYGRQGLWSLAHVSAWKHASRFWAAVFQQDMEIGNRSLDVVLAVDEQHPAGGLVEPALLFQRHAYS